MTSGLDILKEFEGCKLKAYRCPAGVLTIGWGRTTGVKSGQTCTQEQADAWLAEEWAAFRARVKKLITRPSTDAQIDALTSLAYNVGLANLTRSTLLRYHNTGRLADAQGQFRLWNKAGGKVLAGLVRRRAAEAALYAS